MRKLVVLSSAIALAMGGVGIILPVMPFHVGRLGVGALSTARLGLHMSLLAAGYALMQLLLAPVWGRLSDSIGRRPLLAIGLIGFAIGQGLCGFVNSLATLYAVRLATGIFSAATIPAAFAYVADATTEEDRTQGMAQLSGAAGLGFVIGPAIGGLLAGVEVPRLVGLRIDSYSLPFLAAAGSALVALLTLHWLDEPSVRAAHRHPEPEPWMGLARRLGFPVVVAMIAQIAVAAFETTFALHARAELGMGPARIGTVFMECGLVMLVVQLGGVPRLARRGKELRLVVTGLVFMGASLALLASVRIAALVYALVALFSTGIGLVTPTTSALVSRRGGRHAGAALGIESAAKSLGQIAGPLLGGALLGWSMMVPFWLAGALLLALAPLFARSAGAASMPEPARWGTAEKHEPAVRR